MVNIMANEACLVATSTGLPISNMQRRRVLMVTPPRRDRDERRSQIDGPDHGLPGDQSPAHRAAQAERLEQIERNLDRLAEQLRDLTIALRR